MLSYPLVGAILGLILWGAGVLLLPYLPPLHLGVLLFGIWVLLTGALHLDGFADTVDGLFVAKERAFEVMKDPRVGAMGMLFSGVFLLLKASALAHVEALYLIPLVLMLSRFNASLAIYFFPYVSKNGMSTLAKEEFTRAQLLFTLLYVLAFGMWLSWVLVVVSLFVLLACSFFFMRRYGGFSGDIYGFLIETTELVLLHAILFGSTF